VRESLAPLVVAKFFSTLVPNVIHEKISAKAFSTQKARPQVFTKEDIDSLQMGTLIGLNSEVELAEGWVGR
jgi:hypothetical protein